MTRTIEFSLAGLLTRPICNRLPVSFEQWLCGYKLSSVNTEMELTAADTVADFHGIPSCIIWVMIFTL